jgi:hypothetical protein
MAGTLPELGAAVVAQIEAAWAQPRREAKTCPTRRTKPPLCPNIQTMLQGPAAAAPGDFEPAPGRNLGPIDQIGANEANLSGYFDASPTRIRLRVSTSAPVAAEANFPSQNHQNWVFRFVAPKHQGSHSTRWRLPKVLSKVERAHGLRPTYPSTT